MLTIPGELVDRLHQLAARRAPNEMVCMIGSELDSPDFLTVCVEVRNDAPNPNTHWVVRPFEQYETEQQFTARGRVLRAVAHSHPTSDASPSKTDLTFCPDELAMIIVSVPDKEIAVYESGEPQAWKKPVEAAA